MWIVATLIFIAAAVYLTSQFCFGRKREKANYVERWRHEDGEPLEAFLKRVEDSTGRKPVLVRRRRS